MVGLTYYVLFLIIRKMKELMKMLVLITIIMLLIPFGAAAQDSLVRVSLKEAVRLGLNQNTAIKNSQLEVEKSRYGLNEAKNMLYPQIEGYTDFLYSYAIPRMAIPGEILGQSGSVPVEFGTKYDWSFGLRATQVLFNISYYTSLRLAEKMIKLKKTSLQQKEEEIIEQVTQVYYLCKTTEYQMNQLQVSIQNMDKLLDIAQLQVENHVIKPADYARIKIDKNNLQTEADQLVLLHHQQLNMLKYLLGLSLNNTLVLTDTLHTNNDVIVNNIAPDQRPEIQLIEQQISMAELDIKKTSQTFMPQVNLVARHYYQGMRDQFDFFDGGEGRFFDAGIVGLNIKMPLFDGFARKQKINQLQINLMQLENSRKNAIQYFNKEYADVLSKYRQSLRAYQRQYENIQLAEENYKVNLAGYREQVTSLTDLLLAENSLTESKLALYNVLLQLKNAELKLNRLTGKLLSLKKS